MTIGIDAHNLEGKRTGVGRYVFNLLKEWAESRHSERSEESIKDPSAHGLRMTNKVKFILYFKSAIPADAPRADFFEYKLLNVRSTAKFIHWDLPRAAAKDKVDILFCPAYVAPLFYKGKIALTLHDISYETRPGEFNWSSPADRVLLRWVSRQSAKKAAVIFTPSEFSRQEIIEHYSAPAASIVVTPLAVDAALSAASVETALAAGARQESRKKYGLKGKFAFYVGSIFARRHLPEIIKAFEQLAKESDCQFLISGQDYTAGKSVDRLARELNRKLGRAAILRVDFIGDRELSLLYSACAFFIWLSDYEGFGLPPLEAMSLGAPVITTNASSLSEVAGEAALLIEDNSDVKEIFRAMHKLMRDPVLREELVARGREQAVKFSWQACAEKTLNYLLKLGQPSSKNAVGQ